VNDKIEKAARAIEAPFCCLKVLQTCFGSTGSSMMMMMMAAREKKEGKAKKKINEERRPSLK
jgi:hypothetical protein